MEEIKPKKKMGFACMSPERRREIASMGAKAAGDNRYKFTKEAASVAGKLGGLKVSQDRSHMSEIGRLGGLAGRKKREATNGNK